MEVMGRYRLFSDRAKDADSAGSTDVYRYDAVPGKTRVQIKQIIAGAFGDAKVYRTSAWRDNPAWPFVRKTVCHEQGKDHFGHSNIEREDVLAEIEASSTEGLIDLVEVCCVALQEVVAKDSYWRQNWKATIDPAEAVEDINFRLRDGGVGYQFVAGQMVRVDSEYAHAEVVKPALSLLNEEGFEGPQSEFLSAHEHYRSGRYKEAIAGAANAFESLMKAVCDRHGWEYKKGARASDLLKVLRAHKLWPDYLDASFDQLVATLASGLPQVRNEDAAHGQGAVPKTVPDYVAAYALHLAGAKMILISRAAAEWKPSKGSAGNGASA